MTQLRIGDGERHEAIAALGEYRRMQVVNAVLPLIGATCWVLAVTLGAWWLFLLSGPVLYAIMKLSKRG